MGNLLCREKTPRRVYVKGPIQGSAYNPQLFSQDSIVSGTRKDTSIINGKNKMYFSTPNLQIDKKSTVSLDARIFDRGNALKSPPIAPPRKKRTTLKKGSTLPSSLSKDVVPNGFNEIFGTCISTSNINNYDKDKNAINESSISDERDAAPERKLKIGNKKSDKFFGESLSDYLSDEPFSNIIMSKEDNELEESKKVSDKNLSSFLLNMLDDLRNAEDEEKYKGKVPVEEPLCIIKKKETKHICDNDDCIHIQTIHKNDNDHAPPKPDRDFTKFKSTTPNHIDVEILEMSNIEKCENIQAKVIVKRGLSRENLPTPPATPNRKKGSTTPAITIETIDASVKKVVDDRKPRELNEIQDIEGSITTNLVDLVINKAYGMSDFNYHPEDFSHHTHNDGSNLVTPTSKLAVRKISTTRKISTESAPSLDNEMINVQINNTSCSTKKDLPVVEKDNKASISNDEKNVKENTYASSDVNDIINEIYTKNSDIIKEFQSFLEQSIEKEPIINIDEETRFLDSSTCINRETKDIAKETDCELDNCSYSDSFESTDEEMEDKNKNISVSYNADKEKSELEKLKRRESIEDVDVWFSNHIEMDQKESDVCNSYVGEQRLSIGYDTNKIFPFGSTITGRRDSQSDEFFTDITSGNQRIRQETVPKVENSIEEEDELKKENDQKFTTEKRESSPDHSTLLKFLDKTHIPEHN